MSARVSITAPSEGGLRPPDDTANPQRSHKKMKASIATATYIEDEQMNHNQSSQSYKEKLLNAFGNSESDEEIWDENEKDFPENRWYDEDFMSGPAEPKTFNPRPEIVFTEEEIDQWSKRWRNTLIVKVLGKRVTFKHLESKLTKDWAQKGSIKVADMQDGFFSVRLRDQADYKRALYEGPWKISDHYLIVQRWRPFFSWSADLTQKIAVWIRIPGLPLELCNEVFLKRIGNTIGTMLKVDEVTALHNRGKFARICVEINLKTQLPSHVVIKGVHLCLEYEGLHAICFRCGKYGHKKDKCSEFMGQENTSNTDIPNGSGTTSDATTNAENPNSSNVSNPEKALVVMKEPATEEPVIGEPVVSTQEGFESGFGPWNIPKKVQRKKNHNQKKEAQKVNKADVKGGFKYSSSI